MPKLVHRVVCVGRRASDPFLDAADAYRKRLAHYAQVDVVRLRDAPADVVAQHMLAATPADAQVVALDERGKPWTTLALHDFVQHTSARCRSFVFYIGGADGLGAAAKQRAGALWALSPLTLPHRAALAILLEQLYRVHTLRAGEKYHRA